MPRDNFSQSIKIELSLRAAHFCSNPRCLRLTAGPRSGLLRGLARVTPPISAPRLPEASAMTPIKSEAERRLWPWAAKYLVA